MVKQSNVTSVRVLGLKPTTIAALQGTFFALIGLAIAVMFTIGATVNITSETDSLLKGLTFGLAQGFLAIVFVPLLYFVIGWLIGLVQGYVLNAVLGMSGGVVVDTAND
jgi:hypothetical protein